MVFKLNVSYEGEFSPEIKSNLRQKKIKANRYEISRFQCQENYRETAPYLVQPGHQCLHLLKNNTSYTRNLFPRLGEWRDEYKALLFFTGWEAEFKVLATPYNPLGHCLRKDFLTAIWFAMFENSVKIKLLHIQIFAHELVRQTRPSNWT